MRLEDESKHLRNCDVDALDLAHLEPDDAPPSESCSMLLWLLSDMWRFLFGDFLSAFAKVTPAPAEAARAFGEDSR